MHLPNMLEVLLNIEGHPPHIAILKGSKGGKYLNTHGVGTEMGFDLSGDLPGYVELVFVELGEDLVLALAIKV